MHIKIKENSFIAKLAAKKLGYSNVALTIGKTIYLYGAKKSELINDKRWLRHELKHTEQALKFGRIWFIILYLFESIKKGYKNNKFEIEARDAEQKMNILEKYL